MWILSVTHQKPLGHIAKPLALGSGNTVPHIFPTAQDPKSLSPQLFQLKVIGLQQWLWAPGAYPELL